MLLHNITLHYLDSHNVNFASRSTKKLLNANQINSFSSVSWKCLVHKQNACYIVIEKRPGQNLISPSQ